MSIISGNLLSLINFAILLDTPFGIVSFPASPSLAFAFNTVNNGTALIVTLFSFSSTSILALVT